MTPDKSLIEVEAVSSGLTCPNLLIRISAGRGWTVYNLAAALPLSSASTGFIYTTITQTPYSFFKFQISYKRKGKEK